MDEAEKAARHYAETVWVDHAWRVSAMPNGEEVLKEGEAGFARAFLAGVAWGREHPQAPTRVTGS